MSSPLTFELTPTLGILTVPAFLKAVDDILRVVRSVDYAATGERPGRRWLVDGLHSSAPTITIRPALDGAETIDDVIGGLGLLMASESLSEPPTHFSADTLDSVMRLRPRFSGENQFSTSYFLHLVMSR